MNLAKRPEVLSELIGLVYDCALDSSRWSAFLERFATAVDGSGTTLFTHDFASSESAVDAAGPQIAAFVRFDPAALQSLGAYYDRRNVWAQNEAALQEGVAVTSDVLYPDVKLYGTEWGADWLKPQDLKYCMGGVVLKRGTVGVKFSSIRPPSRGPFGDDELSLYRLLLPHLRRASLLHMRMRQLTGLHDAAAEQMDALPFGILFLSAEGRVLHANACAHHLMARHDGFYVDAVGRCGLGVRSEDSQFKRIIHDATRTAVGDGLSAGGSMRATRLAGAPLSISIAPIRSAHAQGVYQLGITPAVVLLISDPAMAPRTTADTIAALYGLTPAESELTAVLIQGVQPLEYADRRRVSRNTVTTQVKSIMHKLGARRQADIVRIVLSGPAILAPPESR